MYCVKWSRPGHDVHCIQLTRCLVREMFSTFVSSPVLDFRTFRCQHGNWRCFRTCVYLWSLYNRNNRNIFCFTYLPINNLFFVNSNLTVSKCTSICYSFFQVLESTIFLFVSLTWIIKKKKCTCISLRFVTNSLI